MGAPDQQHLTLAAQQGIDGDKNGGIRCAGPCLMGCLQCVPLFLQCAVGGAQGKLAQEIQAGCGELALQPGQGGFGLSGGGREIGGTQGGGIGRRLPFQCTQIPVGKVA